MGLSPVDTVSNYAASQSVYGTSLLVFCSSPPHNSGREIMPQGMGRIGLGDSCPLEILRHDPLDGTDTHGCSWEGGTRKQYGHGRPLGSPPLAQHLLQIRRDVHDSIDASFAVVHPDSALGPIDGRPGEARDLAHAQAT